MNSKYSVAVLVISPEGVPLVKDPKKPMPRFWKLPGGRSEGNETAEECAVREVEEEIGITINIDDLFLLKEEDRHDHVLVVFKINVASLGDIKKVGNEREEIRVFKPAEILKLPDLFPNHRATITEHIHE